MLPDPSVLEPIARWFQNKEKSKHSQRNDQKSGTNSAATSYTTYVQSFELPHFSPVPLILMNISALKRLDITSFNAAGAWMCLKYIRTSLSSCCGTNLPHGRVKQADRYKSRLKFKSNLDASSRSTDHLNLLPPPTARSMIVCSPITVGDSRVNSE